MRARCYDFRLSVLGGVAIGLLAFAVPAAATVTSGAEALATSLDDAWRACNAPQLSSADRIAHCTTIIESGRAKPVAHAQALMARGFGYVFQKDFDRALADFDAAIRNNPKLAAAYYYRGAIQMGRDPKHALADINKAISLNPRDPDYFRERSSLYAKRKEYPRAIADLTTAIGLAKKPTREYFLRGAAYEDIGQRDKAIADFQAHWCSIQTTTCCADISSIWVVKSPKRCNCRLVSAAQTTSRMSKELRAAPRVSSRER